MTEQLNRQRVTTLLDAFYAGDIDRVLAQCSDDVEHFASAPIELLPHLGHHRGKAELRATWEAVHSRYAEMRHKVRDMIADGDRVVVDVRVYLGKPSGRVIQFDVAVFYTLQDGLITRIREIMDTFDLVEQVFECDLAQMVLDNQPVPH